MCLDPASLALASLALSATSAVTSYVAQGKAADNQAKAINQQNQATHMDAERQAGQQYEQASGEVNAQAMQARRDAAAYGAIVGEGGSGVSAQRRYAAIGIQNGQDLATIQSNATHGQQETAIGAMASTNKASQQLASISQPSLLQAGLTIGSAAANYGTAMNRIKNPSLYPTYPR